MLLWCHIRHLNLIDKNPQIITKKGKGLVSKLNYERINFPVSKKDYCKIEVQNKFCINVFCYENKVVYPVYLSDQKFSDSVDLLLIPDKLKSHYARIKDFDRFMFNKTKYRVKLKSHYVCIKDFDRFMFNKTKYRVKLKSHYVCIKDFDRFMFNKTKYGVKKYFFKNSLQCFSSEKI